MAGNDKADNIIMFPLMELIRYYVIEKLVVIDAKLHDAS